MQEVFPMEPSSATAVSDSAALCARTDQRWIGRRRTIGGDEIAETIHRTLGQRPISATHCGTPALLWRSFRTCAFCCFPRTDLAGLRALSRVATLPQDASWF